MSAFGLCNDLPYADKHVYRNRFAASVLSQYVVKGFSEMFAKEITGRLSKVIPVRKNILSVVRAVNILKQTFVQPVKNKLF